MKKYIKYLPILALFFAPLAIWIKGKERTLDDVCVQHVTQNNKLYSKVKKRWQNLKQWARNLSREEVIMGTAVAGGAAQATWMAYKKGWIPTKTIRKVGQKVAPYVAPWKWNFWKK